MKTNFFKRNAAKIVGAASTVAVTGLMLAQSVHAAAPTLDDIYSSSDLETAATAAVTQVGPYVLALFGILLVVGIAMALLGKAKRGVVAHFR